VHPSIVSVWGTDVLEAPRLSPFHYLITRYALARADEVTATGMRLAEATMRYVPAGKPVTVVPYGVDLERFSPRPREARGEIVVGAVARLSPEKGLGFLLRAVGRLVDEGKALRVVLAGDGPERRRLERLAGRLGLGERVEFLGEAPHEEIPRILQGFDIFAMPSLAEGFGVAALEAAAMELPVVGSRVHGIPDVVADGESGLLVPPRDVAALAEAIGRLVDDGGLRTRLGRGGRALVESRYRWQDNAAQMERLYRALAGPFTNERPHARLL
jgi:glycosyltransferase involved in cell wall biosynthesis